MSSLLTIFGFSIASYGKMTKYREGPDIIAEAPSGNIGIIECTVGLLNNNDKLAKLVQRTSLFREKLKEVGYPFLEIQPAIVTPLTRDEVKADIEMAGIHGIAVVCKENLEH